MTTDLVVSIITVISSILGSLAAIAVIYQFIYERLHKQNRDTKLDECESNNQEFYGHKPLQTVSRKEQHFNLP